MKEHKNEGMGLGIIIGLAGGVMGSILVTSMYRFIDGAERGLNELTFYTAAAGFFLILFLIYRSFK